MNRLGYKYKLVVVVRSDISLSTGKIAAQAAHAAVSCSLSALKKSKKDFDEWYSEGQRKVVLKVRSERELHELYADARNMGLTTALITDAGLTEIPPNTTTCLGIGPAVEKDIDRITGNLPLL